jgi:hypothetical protein
MGSTVKLTLYSADAPASTGADYYQDFDAALLRYGVQDVVDGVYCRPGTFYAPCNNVMDQVGDVQPRLPW